MFKKRAKKFFRISPSGRRALDKLIKENPSAARCFLVLAGNATRRGIVHATLQGLATYLELSTFTISRAVNTLVRLRYVERAPLYSRSAFMINASVIWMSKGEDIWTAPFNDPSVIPPWKPFLKEGNDDAPQEEGSQ